MKLLPLNQVRLLPGDFARAVDVDLAYALQLDPGRLLAPFRREAGLAPLTPSYGNWEDSGLDGHTAGHYLSAMSFLWASTGSVAARGRVTTIVEGLVDCQRASGDGYIGGIPGGRALFASLPDGGLDAVARLSGHDYWVPWYNLHKTFQGLIDAHSVAGEERALPVVVALAQWWLRLAEQIDDDVFESMLDIEFGGMNDAFARLAQITGRAEFADAARRFSHRAILDPLLHGQDALTGLHANTQIPKAIGYASTAAATGDTSYLTAADVFWRAVVDHRTVAIGGNSVREHFHAAGDFSPMIDDREGPEFCNTYNMLKLTRALAEHDLRPEHLEFAERALFNHVLGSQHPERGGFVYFTSMRPRHYRVYSQPQLGFWCCVGTGLEAQARYGEWVFGIDGDAVAVNLYLPAEASIPEFGTRIEVHADLPTSGAISVLIDPGPRRTFPLRLRVPKWAGELRDLRLNGQTVAADHSAGAMILERLWSPGDTITFTLPLGVRAERLPDGSPWQAYLRGPSVLAARAGERHLVGLRADASRMGHIAGGPLFPLGDLPLVAPLPSTPTHGADDRPVRAVDPEQVIPLEPFAGIHDARYTVYWPIVEGDIGARRDLLTRADRGLTLDDATIDVVALGEQQPESDHAFRSAGARTITADDSRWRVTDDWLSVDVAARGARTLRVRYRTSGDPTAVIVSLGGFEVAEERFDGVDEVLDIEYPIHDMLSQLDDTDRAVLTFAAADGRATPGISDLRLLR